MEKQIKYGKYKVVLGGNMQNLILSINAVVPLFLLMMLGYSIKMFKIASKRDFDIINKLVFKIFLPILLFYNIYTTESIKTFDKSIVLFVTLGACVIFLVGYIFVKFGIKDNKKRAPMLQGFFRTNFAILGIPLINSICGENVTGLTYLMVAIVVPMFNVLAVICFELFNTKKGNINVKSLLVGVISNPLIIGCLIGLLFFVLKIKLPFVLEKAISDVSKIATPLAIVAIGGSFTFRSIKNCMKEVFITVSSRLVLIPVVAVTLAAMLGFRGEALACILIVFGGPVAISSFPMAQQMDCDEEIAANVVVFSSFLCIFTLFCWIFILSTLSLF